MIARNFCIVCTVVVVFAILFANLVDSQHKYGDVTGLRQNIELR